MPDRSKRSHEMSLDRLHPGQRGRIVRICPSPYSVRLLEVGCLPGSEVQQYAILGKGDRLAIEVNGVIIALRRQEAETIIIEVDEAA